MLWALMSKATIHEDGDLLAGENDVRPHSQPGHLNEKILSKTMPFVLKQGPQSHLWGGLILTV